jgi:hypothetical protein
LFFKNKYKERKEKTKKILQKNSDIYAKSKRINMPSIKKTMGRIISFDKKINMQAFQRVFFYKNKFLITNKKNMHAFN